MEVLKVIDRELENCEGCNKNIKDGKYKKDLSVCKSCSHGKKLLECGEELTNIARQGKKQEEKPLTKKLSVEKLRDLKAKDFSDEWIIKEYGMYNNEYYRLKEAAGLKRKHVKSPIKEAVEKVNAGETLKQQIEELKELIERKNTEVNKLKKSNEGLEKECSDLTKLVETLRNELTKTDKLIMKSRESSEKNGSNDEVLKLEQEVKVLNSENELSEKVIDELNRELKMKDVGVEQLKEYNGYLIKESDQQKEKIKHLEKLLIMYLGDSNV